ncbi:hypothetical protein J4479_05185 [Candidatus Woesearchaeota archaeon]|nr:hypothetical protein [uncultured archaeon]MBS3140370.1 hypothetical protein [Candidatus Woesearchaeota archaeon]
MTTTILIPQTQVVLATVYESLELGGIEKAQRQIPKYERAAFLPELALARIAADSDSYIWNHWFTTNSLIVTGQGKITNQSKKGGNEYVVVAHVPHELSDPYQIRYLTRDNFKHLLFGAGEYSPTGFLELLDRNDGQLVHLIDYSTLRKSSSGLIPTVKAMSHPLFIPAFGDETTAQNYLKKFEQVKGKSIGILYYSYLDVVPRARVLFLGYYDDNALSGNDDINVSGRFVGVPRSGHAPQAHSAEKKDHSLEEQLLALAEEHVSKGGRRDYQMVVRKILGR